MLHAIADENNDARLHADVPAASVTVATKKATRDEWLVITGKYVQTAARRRCPLRGPDGQCHLSQQSPRPPSAHGCARVYVLPVVMRCSCRFQPGSEAAVDPRKTLSDHVGMRLELFYDVISPWSFLAFETLCRYRHAWDLDLVLRPAFLGGVFAATGNTPPAGLPSRAVYLLQDLARSSRQFEVPLAFPSAFPGNTIVPMRVLSLVAEEQPRHHEDLARALWQRYWSDDIDITQPELLRAACVDIGLGTDLIERSADADNKARLRAATEEAVARGAFGFPAMFVENTDGSDDLYFGSDRLSLMAFERGLPWSGPVPKD